MRRILSTLFVTACVLVATPTTGHAAATWTKAGTTVAVACGSSTLSQAANWYFPATTTPKALVYLQHGFSRSNANMDALAGKYADAGFLVFAPTLPSSTAGNNCAVNNTGDNTAFLNNVAGWLGELTTSTSNLAKSYTTAAGKAGRTGQAPPAKYVIAGHSAGGDAVTYIANRLRTTYPAAFANLKFLQLLDPVLSPNGTNMATGLAGLAGTSLPIYAISSPPYTANSQASGTTELIKDVPRSFLGVRLTTGSHCDAEGASTNFLCTLLGGTSKAANVTALQTFAVNWANDAVAGTSTAIYYPGGTYYQGLLTAGTITTLSGS
ncbi:hypothetical protein BJ973_003414 [Actinoplanes tereljensis]|uniref:alpha/beta hydrolase n=1 Tax=Paractinoplanes tereljensis TaxID=571912 RepID=UPI001EF1D139|nr:alpha/beta hydrolase [Actinoplanes tereljensis]